MHFLHKTHASLFALGNTKFFSSMHASYLKQQNHNPNHRNVENMTLNTLLKGPSSKSEQKQQSVPLIDLSQECLLLTSQFFFSGLCMSINAWERASISLMITDKSYQAQ